MKNNTSTIEEEARKISSAEFRKRVEEGKLVSLDYGKSGVAVHDGEQTFLKDASEAFGFIKENYKGWSLVGENAHFGVPRTEKSLAQPWKGEYLLELYNELEEGDIVFRFSPQQSTPTILAYSNLDPTTDKGEENDAISLHKYVTDHQKFCLKKPPACFKEDHVRKEGYAMKDAMNTSINASKTNGYGARDPECIENHLDRLSRNSSDPFLNTKSKILDSFNNGNTFVDLTARWIYNNIDEIESKLSETPKSAFMQYSAKGSLASFKMPQVYAVVNSLMGKPDMNERNQLYINDQLRMREHQNELAYWNFAKTHLFCYTPFHQKGGVASSNLKYHGQRHWVANKAKEQGRGTVFKNQETVDGRKKSTFKPKAQILQEGNGDVFSSFRGDYVKSVQELFNIVRKMLVSEKI
jgi:hypothetical protein